jgi:hypothetical protein
MALGRKPSLTPALQQAIVTAVAGGVPYVQACLLAGIKKATAIEWLERGEGRHSVRPSTPLYASFADAIARARAQDESRRILRINQAGQGGAVIYEKVTTYPDGRQVREVRHAEPSWQADAFHLSRAYADRWGAKVQANVNLEIKALATKVASELGLEVEALMAEAQALLQEAR